VPRSPGLLTGTVCAEGLMKQCLICLKPLGTICAEIFVPGNFRALVTKPTPPSDYTPLGRRCDFQAGSVFGFLELHQKSLTGTF
jgi:hypothetical protein